MVTHTNRALRMGHDSSETAERILRPLWDAIGREPCYPAGDDDAVELMTAAGYELTQAGLDELLATSNVIRKTRIVSPPEDEVDGHEWSAIELRYLLAHLETLQRWQPTPSIHDPKKNKWRLARELAQKSGDVEQLTADAGQYTIEHLLALLNYAGTVSEAQAIIEILRYKTEQMGVLTK